MSSKPELKDYNEGRGKREGAPLGTTVFIGLRALDPLVQRTLLLSAPLTTLLPKLGLSAPIPPPNAPIVPLTGLSPLHSVIWFMSIGSAVKQCFYLVFTSKEPMYADMATMVAIFNLVINSVNTLLFTASPSLPFQFPPYQIYIGAAIYLLGMFLEAGSEIQRRRFKDDPKNDGKPYMGGLFSIARHINYGGYTLWRGAYALACGGPIWGSIIALFFAWDFGNRAIPVLNQYCEKRYGKQWEEYRRKVQWKLLPGLY